MRAFRVLQKSVSGNFAFKARCQALCSCESKDDMLSTVHTLKNKSHNSFQIDMEVKKLMYQFEELDFTQRKDFITNLAHCTQPDTQAVVGIAKSIVENKLTDEEQLIRAGSKLKTLLTPDYEWLFIQMGRVEGGVKFLADLRGSVIDYLNSINITNKDYSLLQQLNVTLKNLLLLWFSVGFLKLERITWNTSCSMLQKISEYEAIHPVKSWVDIKRRVGPYRRCYAYTHKSMPGEPIMVLHTALMRDIATKIQEINPVKLTEKQSGPDVVEDFSDITAATFYSIFSTQKGLSGIDLGNHIIKQVVKEIQTEIPQISKFSTLSPIPNFKDWLLAHMKHNTQKIFSDDEMKHLATLLGSGEVFVMLRKILNSNEWLKVEGLSELLREPFIKMCIRYLYLEKKRGYALNTVANFHLRNGAEMWRINWLADTSPRGLANSCGIMINYRYFFERTEENSEEYIKNKTIKVSKNVKQIIDHL